MTIERKFGLRDAGNQMWDMGNKKWGFIMLTSHFPFPTWHFDTNNLILPREMGNGNQMRILVTEVWPSANHIPFSHSYFLSLYDPYDNLFLLNLQCQILTRVLLAKLKMKHSWIVWPLIIHILKSSEKKCVKKG